MNNERTKVLKGLEPLFKKARKEKLWFYSPYQNLWFSPSDLKKEQRNGRFIWGACNWRLRDPRERLNEFSLEIIRMEREYSDFLHRIADDTEA